MLTEIKVFFKNQYFEIGKFQRLQNFGVNVCEFCQEFVLTRTFQYKTAHTSRWNNAESCRLEVTFLAPTEQYLSPLITSGHLW